MTEGKDDVKERKLTAFIDTFSKVTEAYRQIRRTDKNNEALPLDGLQGDTSEANKENVSVSIHDIRRLQLVGILEPIVIASYLKIRDIQMFNLVLETVEKVTFRVYKVGPGWNKISYKRPNHWKAAYNLYNDILPVRDSEKQCLPRSLGDQFGNEQNLTSIEYVIHYLCNFTLNVAKKTLSNLQGTLNQGPWSGDGMEQNAYDDTKRWGAMLLFEYEKADNDLLRWVASSNSYFNPKKRRGIISTSLNTSCHNHQEMKIELMLLMEPRKR